MTTILDLLNKFNIPNQNQFEKGFSEEVEEKLFEGTLTVEKNFYTIQYEYISCEIDVNTGDIEIFATYPDGYCAGGDVYCANGEHITIDT